MASKYPKQTKILNLDLSEIPQSSKARVKKEIGEFVINEMLLDLGDGKSPVAGRGSFKKLNKLKHLSESDNSFCIKISKIFMEN